jgi:magnesium transporter
MLTVLVQRHGTVEQASTVDPAWLAPGAPEIVWGDIESPGEADRDLLIDTFHIHELAVEDALAEIHFPKIELYDSLLYLILHGIINGARTEGFVTMDLDFFIGRNFLVTVHHGPSRSIEA